MKCNAQQAGGAGAEAGCAVTGSKGMAFSAYAHSYVGVQLSSSCGMCGTQSRAAKRREIRQRICPRCSPACVRPVAGQKLLFSNGHQGNKSFAHSFTRPTSPLHVFLTTPAQQINGHKAFLPVGGAVGVRPLGRRAGHGGLLSNLRALSASPQKL